MKAPTLKDKAAYYAKVRAANYADSLRLEGFDVRRKEGKKPPSAAAAIKKRSRTSM